MSVVVRCRLLIDGSGGAPIPDGVIVVDDGKISDIGPASSVKAPPGSESIDCREETVLPAFIEAHSHVPYCGANRLRRQFGTLEAQAAASPVLKHLRMYRNCLDDMMSGVTTVRSLGADDDSDLVLRDLIASGALPGPRILASGKPIRPSHGTAAFLGRAADGVEGVRRAVREIVAKGCDVVKVFATNVQAGMGETAYRLGDLTSTPAYTLEELRVICGEAHNAGLRVAAHAIGGPALRWAMEAGADSVEHANLMEEGDVEVFLKTGCVLSDPNLYLFFDKEYGFECRPTWRELPPWWREKVAVAAEHTRIHQAEAYRAGVRFALALDSGHGLIWREAACMAEILGASPMDVICALTRNTAELCGLDNLGTLAPGKSADLISVAGNPLEDVTCLKEVRMVMKEGRRYESFLREFTSADASANQLGQGLSLSVVGAS